MSQSSWARKPLRYKYRRLGPSLDPCIWRPLRSTAPTFSAAAPSHTATSKKSSRNTLATGSPCPHGRKDPNSKDPVVFPPSPQSKMLVPTFLFTIHLRVSLECKFKAAGPGLTPSPPSPRHPACCLHRVSAQQTRAERMNGRSEQVSASPSRPEFSPPRSPAAPHGDIPYDNGLPGIPAAGAQSSEDTPPVCPCVGHTLSATHTLPGFILTIPSAIR